MFLEFIADSGYALAQVRLTLAGSKRRTSYGFWVVFHIFNGETFCGHPTPIRHTKKVDEWLAAKWLAKPSEGQLWVGM
eukprot:scaffold338431_cov33-Prasinocladus_malaysianus.AAC.1